MGEAYPFTRGSRLVLSVDNHNSVNGLREYARARDASVAYVPVGGPGLRLDERRLEAALTARPHQARHGHDDARGLLAYPAQSNFTGVRHPLDWIARARALGYDGCSTPPPTSPPVPST
ncbi:hypothetical protein [Streptomyces gibsoniae]|uniref:Uncharacterized protein n=1 Tax=Streptomyces gibsoniae TaxID=3075529 RepID=A0ABU2TRQ1_9ACTN|nr:hypothetical protein [Streptomyces sp. DSM 41699]MDT0463641.1 hypothetical protein [Streptomyces sp. DSM 41699]